MCVGAGAGVEGCLPIPPWLARLALLVSSRLAVIVPFQLFHRPSLLTLASNRPRAPEPQSPRDPEPPGTAKDPPNWMPVAVSSSLFVGFIGLLVTLLPPNALFLLRPVASRLSEALLMTRFLQGCLALER